MIVALLGNGGIAGCTRSIGLGRMSAAELMEIIAVASPA